MGKKTFRDLGYSYRKNKGLIILTRNGKDHIAFYSIQSAIAWLKQEAWNLLYA